jgi:hypothetical protein
MVAGCLDCVRCHGCGVWEIVGHHLDTHARVACMGTVLGSCTHRFVCCLFPSLLPIVEYATLLIT